MSDFQKAKSDFLAFKQNLENNGDLASLSTQMRTLKIALATKLQFLDVNATVDNRALARDILEHGILLSVKGNDDAAFERHFEQVRGYYHDATGMPESSLKDLVLGLNLLRLLAANRLADFHIELELIDEPKWTANPFISYPVKLEQYMMEGSFNKVLRSEHQLPSPWFQQFASVLGDTVRTQIAECTQQAFGSLTVAEAQRILHVESEEQVMKYASKFSWTREGDQFIFQKPTSDHDRPIPKKTIIAATLQYAKELEKIV